MTPTPKTQMTEALLYSYRIASADLKYIEINTREVHLRNEPDKGPVLRGELPDCGPTCHASLSEIFLEHAMSCKGCENESALLKSVAQFGERIGEKLSAVFLAHDKEKSPQEIVPFIFDCVLDSMGAPYQKKSTADQLHFMFTKSPLEIYAEKFGLHMWISPAYQGLIAFFESIVKASGGAWVMLSPKASEGDELLKLSLKKTS